jgi:DNA invertase Pin-like site-specific DNA recombinase
MAGLLSVFAEFEHEILRERIRAGIAEARLQGAPHGFRQTSQMGQAVPQGQTRRQKVSV